MNGSNNESNGGGDETPAGTPPGPPPAYQGQPQQEMSLEALAYIEEQRRQSEQRAIFVQIYSAALTGILSGIAAKGDKITADNAALMAWTHANAGLQLLNRGASQPMQQQAPPPPQQQAIVPVAQPRPPQQQPQQNPYQQQGAPFGNPYAQPYGNPYGGPVRGGMGPQGRPMQPPPGTTRGPTGQIQTGLGNFQYEVHYGPRNG